MKPILDYTDTSHENWDRHCLLSNECSEAGNNGEKIAIYQIAHSRILLRNKTRLPITGKRATTISFQSTKKRSKCGIFRNTKTEAIRLNSLTSRFQ